MLLKVADAKVHYNKVAALKGISLEVPDGGIVTIIGANGAGKSTTLRAISGLVGLSGGEIWLGERRIDGTAPEKIVAAGIGHVPEGRRVFPDLTVEENCAPAPSCARTRSPSSATWTRSSSTSRGCANGAASGPRPCPAASSRCWRSAGR